MCKAEWYGFGWGVCVCVFSFFYWDITAATRMLYDNLWSYSFFDIFILRRRQRRGVIPSLLVSVASFFKSVLLLKIASWQFFGWCWKRQTIKFIYDSPWNIPTIIGRWRTVMKKNTAKKISLWICMKSYWKASQIKCPYKVIRVQSFIQTPLGGTHFPRLINFNRYFILHCAYLLIEKKREKMCSN